MKDFIKYILKLGLAMLLLAALLIPVACVKKEQFSAQQMPVFPPATVTMAEAEEQIWEETLSAVGTLRAEKGISLASEVAGIIQKIYFDGGETVKKGQILLELDADVESAQLAAAEARLDLAEINLKRSKKLVQDSSISKSEFDTAEAEAKSARASLLAIQAQIEEKRIKAPFDGRLGIRKVDIGAFLMSGQDIATLQSYVPIKVDFTLPQIDASKLSKGLSIRAGADSYQEEQFWGTLSAVDPLINVETRSLKLEGLLKNDEGKLKPGMFVTIEVVLPEKRNVTVIPETAVYYQSFGNSIFVIKKDENGAGFLEQRFIRTGERKGDYIEVTEGILPGEEVVTTGVFRLMNGQPVVVDNSIVPESKTDPAVDNS